MSLFKMTSTLNKVRFTYVPLPPFVEQNNQDELAVLGGFMPAIIVAIAKWMKFKPIFIREPNDAFGDEGENDTWSGMAGMISRNEVDISMSPASPDERFLKYATYSSAVAMEKYSFLSGKEIQEASFFLFFNVFDSQVWIGTLTGLVLLAFFLTCIYRMTSKVQRTKFYEIFLQYIWILYAFMVQQGVARKWTRWELTSSRIAWVGSMLIILWNSGIALLIMSSFKGGLLSLLTALTAIPLIDTQMDLITKSEIQVISAKGIELHVALEGSGIEVFDAIWKRVEHNLVSPESLFDNPMLAQTEKGKVSIIHGRLILQSVLDKRFESTAECNFHIGREDFFTFPLLVAMRKSLSEEFKEKFNYGITRLIDADIPGKWFKPIKRGANLCQKYFKKELEPLKLRNFHGALILLGFGLAVATIILSLEVLISKRCK